MISSANIYKSSDPQFLRTTTGIQTRLDAFDESRLVINFLTNSGVIQALCCFKLVQERKAGKQIESSRLEFLQKLLANNFELNTAGLAYQPLLGTLLPICQKSQEPSF